MPYCVRTDIKLPDGQIVELCDDETEGNQNPKIAERIASAIADADAEIDAQLNGLYTVPFAVVPPIIMIISSRLAAWNLMSRRTGDKPNNIVKEYDNAQKLLTQIREGKIQLYPDVSVVGSAEPLLNKQASDQMFSKTVLDRMP